MKGRIFVAVILIAAAAVAGRWVNRVRGTHAVGQQETRQTFRLGPGARVEVRGINGVVEVTTAETDTAEVHVVRTADDVEDLEYGQVVVEGSSSYLSVRGEGGGGGGLFRWLCGGGRRVRQEVQLRVPRGVELSAASVNGQVRVGEVEGTVEVTHVNGRVEVAQASGGAEVQHVNGNVTVGISRPDERGVDVAHVNGNIEIRLKELVNADVEVQEQNGGLSLNVPNVTMQERLNRSYTRARFGSGGVPFHLSRVNGNVRFVSDASAGTTAAAPPAPLLDPDEEDAELPPPPPVPPLPR